MSRSRLAIGTRGLSGGDQQINVSVDVGGS